MRDTIKGWAMAVLAALALLFAGHIIGMIAVCIVRGAC